MKRYIAAATGAALVAAVASYSFAQSPTPPGTDRPGGEGGATSAKPNPDKKTPTGTQAAPKGGNPTAPGTDRQAGEEGETSAKPNPDKKQKQ